MLADERLKSTPLHAAAHHSATNALPGSYLAPTRLDCRLAARRSGRSKPEPEDALNSRQAYFGSGGPHMLRRSVLVSLGCKPSDPEREASPVLFT